MRVVSSSDWRDGLAFDRPILLADVFPGEDARCAACDAAADARPRTELWVVKHRHPQHHDGYVRFYCRDHVPVVEPPVPPTSSARPAAPARRRAPSPARPPASDRRTTTETARRTTTPAAERPRAVCPSCFMEVPPTGVCGMCGALVS